jgi:hypothetical protein
MAIDSVLGANKTRLTVPAGLWILAIAGLFIGDHPWEKATEGSRLDTIASMVNIFADFMEKIKITICCLRIMIISN